MILDFLLIFDPLLYHPITCGFFTGSCHSELFSFILNLCNALPDKVGFARGELVLLKISINTSLLIFLLLLKTIFSSNSVSFPFIFVVYPEPNGLSVSPSFIVIEVIPDDKTLL